MQRAGDSKILVIGFGNDLCGEDCAGRVVADRVALDAAPHVVAISTHQLGPEFAEQIAEARLVIFVDATPVNLPFGVLLQRAGVPCHLIDGMAAEEEMALPHDRHPQMIPLRPVEGRDSLLHAPGPASLLRLAKALFGNCPPAMLIAIPASRFEIGDQVSEHTMTAIDEAVDMIRGIAHLPLTGAPLKPAQTSDVRELTYA